MKVELLSELEGDVVHIKVNGNVFSFYDVNVSEMVLKEGKFVKQESTIIGFNVFDRLEESSVELAIENISNREVIAVLC